MGQNPGILRLAQLPSFSKLHSAKVSLYLYNSTFNLFYV